MGFLQKLPVATKEKKKNWFYIVFGIVFILCLIVLFIIKFTQKFAVLLYPALLILGASGFIIYDTFLKSQKGKLGKTWVVVIYGLTLLVLVIIMCKTGVFWFGKS